MKKVLPKKYGNVVIEVLSNHPDEPYSDHEAEDVLLKLYQSANPNKKIAKILGDKPSWPLYYHLSPKRSNLIKWYEFQKDSNILEVGAGCGALTEALIKNKVSVTALELTRNRALINAARNRNANNLKMVVGNLDTYKPNNKFDYIICVGVLEYAGTFYHSKNPYEDFLRSLSNLLVPGGKLLLAIENRFGMKYWSGAREDHAHTFFEGHNGYPGKKRVQTFGRKELTDLLLKTRFNATNFYYPFPDYKSPAFVYSDSFYPGNGTTFPLGTLPTPTLDQPRETFFSEQCTMRFIEANNLFPDFSNSFLVEATK